MKDIFANLYNKVVSFFHQTEHNNNESAKDVACNRLKLVLMQDRTNLSPAIMERMRGELIDLLSKYLELDRELLDLNLAQEDEQMALMLSIPVIRAKDEQEIEEMLKKEDEEKESDENVDEDEDDNNDEEDIEDEDDVEVEDIDEDDVKDNIEAEDENVDNTDTDTKQDEDSTDSEEEKESEQKKDSKNKKK